MSRNAQLVRQWQILQTLQAFALGRSLDELARALNVHQRTIRRDLDALQAVPFSLYCESHHGSRTPRWRLARPVALAPRVAA